jgi:hypothetical protein
VILGDKREFALDLQRFEAPWHVIDSTESVWGSLAIWIAGVNVTLHRREGTDRIRDVVSAPLLPLARWTIQNRSALAFEERVSLGVSLSPHEQLSWWGAAPPPAGSTEDAWLDRRDEWWAAHFTGAATLDVVVPSVGVVRNDDYALVSWRLPDYRHADRVFLDPAGSAVVAWNSFSQALDELIEVLREWSADEALLVPDTSRKTALEFYTGLSAGEIESYGFLPGAAQDPATDPLAQVVRDLLHETALGPEREAISRVVRSAEDPTGGSWLDLRDHLVSPAGASFEDDGYQGAQTTRGLMGLDGQPIVDVDRLVRSVGVQIASESPEAQDRMVVAGRISGGATAMLLSNARTSTSWGRRFELARALGHLLLDPPRGGSIGAASGPRALASRRRRAGAFAAEMLLPTSALREASGGVLDGVTEGAHFRELLERFGVGATTAAYHFWNQGFLSTPEVRDDLIASV